LSFNWKLTVQRVGSRALARRVVMCIKPSLRAISNLPVRAKCFKG
jgi:hypothetical protein